jgi:hypothetical protein
MEKLVFQGMIDRLIEIGRCYGMKINVDKQKYREYHSNHPKYGL